MNAAYAWDSLFPAALILLLFLRIAPVRFRVPGAAIAHLVFCIVVLPLVGEIWLKGLTLCASAVVLSISWQRPRGKLNSAQVGSMLEALLESSLLGGSAWHSIHRVWHSFDARVKWHLEPLAQLHEQVGTHDDCLRTMRIRKAPIELLHVAQLCVSAASFGINFSKGLAQLADRWRQWTLLQQENEAAIAPFLWVNYAFAGIQVSIIAVSLVFNPTVSTFMMGTTLGHAALIYLSCTTGLAMALPSSLVRWRDS